MRKKIWQKSIAVIFLLIGSLVAFSGCGFKAGVAAENTPVESFPDKEREMGQGAEPDETEMMETASFSVWNAYWNLEGVEEQIEELSEKIQNVNYFAAYFDQDDKVFIPQATIDFYEKTKETYKGRGWNCYLTIVNDQILSDGSSSLKSTELLYRLMTDEESYQLHVEEIISLALLYDYDGLEIDYENIRRDNTLWDYFMPFISYLYDRCREEGLELRVVIETNIEPKKIKWVEGPIYVVMCYNLYGSHSGPGPKADRTFLEEIMEKMSDVPGQVDYALANGGFDWSDDGTVTSITTEKAMQMLTDYGAVAERDDISAAKYFSYEDELGVSHEVWYADADTMQAWMYWLASGGNHQFSIWRLGE